MALRVPKLVGSKWVYEYPVSAAPAPESNDGSEHNQGKLATDRVGLNLLSRSLRCSTSVLVFSCWLMKHVTYLKLRKK